MATFPVAHILVRALPSHTTLKLRQEGQNAPEEIRRRDLREALTQAELEHFKKSAKEGSGGERLLVEDGGGEHDLERVLREAAELDADSQDESGPSRSGSSEEDSSSSEEEDSEEGDDTAELLRELDKIKKERAEERERQEREAFEQAAEQRDEEIMQSNPLLPVGDRSGSFAIKRRLVFFVKILDLIQLLFLFTFYPDGTTMWSSRIKQKASPSDPRNDLSMI